MTFRVAAEDYDRHVGRYGRGLAASMIEAAGIRPGECVLDVGCGPGALTQALAEVVGGGRVAAVDPSEPFVEAVRDRVPEADVRLGEAEELPFADGTFDAVLSQLVVNFLSDPGAGVGEMRRVAREGGRVAACVWDYPGEMTLLRVFWDAAAELEPELVEGRDERTTMPFSRRGELGKLWRHVGLRDVVEREFEVSASYTSFDDLWQPFEAGVAPSGAYTASLDPGRRVALRDEYARRLGSPSGPFELDARAWFVCGTR